MYGTRVAQHLLFSCLVLVSSARKERFLPGWGRIDDETSATCECDVKKEISNGIKEEYQKCILKCSQALVFTGSIKKYAKWAQPACTRGATDKELDAFTSCFWIKTVKTTQAPAILSYAVPERDNEFLIILKSSEVKLCFKDEKSTSLGPRVHTGVRVSDGKWHHVCITWKSSDGTVEAYKDGAFQSKKTGIITGQQIAPSGIWIIGQDQDTFGGGFQQRNAFDGSLTDVNVWDKILCASEISTLASKKCGLGMQGNYKAYKDFVPKGGVNLGKPSCCH